MKHFIEASYTPQGLNRYIPQLRRFWYTIVEVGKEVLLWVCTAGRRTMAWCRIQLTEDKRRIVNEERTSHPSLLVRN